MTGFTKYFEAAKHPGKFESDPLAAYLWDLWINGEGEEHYAEGDETELTYFELDADEAEAFGLPVGCPVMVWEDSQGYFNSRTFETREDALKWI